MRKYEVAIVLGIGKMAMNCMKLLQEQNIKIIFFDVNVKGASPYLKSFAETSNIEYYYIPKKEIFDKIRAVEESALLFSIVNPCIFPKDILQKENITAVNMHHALLPNHPGRNGEAWAVYDQDKYAGITWHFIVPEVDAGEIIVQEQVELTEETTSYKLFAKQEELGVAGFEKFYKDLLCGTVTGKKQIKDREYKLHYSKDRPNNGELDLTWDGKQISAFLRSMDYGPLRVLGMPSVVYNDVGYLIKKYKIKKCEQQRGSMDIVVNENLMTITIDDYEFDLYLTLLN